MKNRKPAKRGAKRNAKERIRLKVENFGAEGVAISKHNGKAVLSPYAVPGDIIDAEVVQDKSSYMRAEIKKIVKPSPMRLEPDCPHFGECGGCSYRMISYEKQLEVKHAIVCEAMRNVLKSEQIAPVQAAGQTDSYRSKLQFQCAQKGKRLIKGFYKYRSRNIVEIDYCRLHSKEQNDLATRFTELLNELSVRAYSKSGGSIRDIVIHQSVPNGELSLTAVCSHKNLKEEKKISKILFKEFDKLKAFYVFHNSFDSDYVFKNPSNQAAKDSGSPLHKVFGAPIKSRLAETDFELSPISFFQVNANTAEMIIEKIRQLIKEKGNTGCSLMDLYAGVGTLSLPIASEFKRVFAVEYIREAALLGKTNAKINRISNYTIRQGDAAEQCSRLARSMGYEKLRAEYKYILVDPPRAGLDESMRGVLLDIAPSFIIYVSCNPATQARDADFLLKHGYKTEAAYPFDMFPHSYHTENLMLFEKKNPKKIVKRISF